MNVTSKKSKVKPSPAPTALVEAQFPAEPGEQRKIHLLWDTKDVYRYRVNFFKYDTGLIVRSLFVIVDGDKVITK